MHTRRRTSTRSGFTLIELMVVIAIIALVMAVAMPNLWPIISFSEHEGAARRLAQYGRAATSHAVLSRETITVHVDLDTGEYWCTRIPEPEADADSELDSPEEEERERRQVPEDDMELLNLAQGQLTGTAENQPPQQQDDVLAEQTDRMNERLSARARRGVEARAALVKHEPAENSFNWAQAWRDERDEEKSKSGELEAEPVQSQLLQRAKLPDNVFFQKIVINEEAFTAETVEIPVTPLGLPYKVTFYLAHYNGDLYRVVWDPLTGGASILDGDDS